MVLFNDDIKETVAPPVQKESSQLTARLYNAARDPYAEGKASGVAFEEAIAETFNFMSFNAKRIGGSGDTDIVACWKDNDGKKITAIIDGKSKSGAFVSHGDISDVAIDAHKDRNNADYVAIVGPGFSGDTIRNHAKKKSFALITDTELSEISKLSHSLGLTLQEISLIFLESVLKPSKRRLEAPFSARTALIGLEIRQDSCVKSPCLTKKSAPIRHSAGFKTDSSP